MFEYLIPTLIGMFNSWFGQGTSHQMNRSDLEYMNEYNQPVNQMDRLREAGISGAAAAQSVSGGQSLSAGATAASNSFAPVPNYLDSKVALETLNLQKDVTKAEIELKKSEANKNNVEAANISTMQPYNIQEIQSRLGLNKEQARNFSAMADRIKQLTPIERMQAIRSLDEMAARIQEIYSHQRLMDQQAYNQELRNSVDRLKSNLADKFHVDVDSDWINMLVQFALSGDNNGLNNVVNSVKGMLGVGNNHDFDYIMPDVPVDGPNYR